MGGGMTRTETFIKVVAAVTGDSIGVAPAGESATLGALSLAAAGAEDAELDSLLEARANDLAPVEPVSNDVSLYDDLYHAWRQRERRLNEMEL